VPCPNGEGMGCREIAELATEWFEGTLDEETRRAFVEHVADCEDCAEFVLQLRWTVVFLSALGCS
jgi:Putative zinc-finger